MRDAAYSLLTDSDLRTGHRLAAEFLEVAGETNAAIIAEHFELGGDPLRAAGCYLRAAEDCLERGDYLGTVRQVDRGKSCGPAGEALGQFHSVGITARFYLNHHEGIGEAAAVALKLQRLGSRGWCRSMYGAFIAASGRQDASGMFALLPLLLGTEPEASARASYIETLGGVSVLLAVGAPHSVMQTVGTRLAAVVELAMEATPALRRYLHVHNAGMNLTRYPRPWQALVHEREALRLSREVGDSKMELFHCTGLIEYCWLQLGDREGARQRILSIEHKAAQSQERIILPRWRHSLAWVLCADADESAWDQAEKLANQLVGDTSGMVFFPCWGQSILARVALLRGQIEEAAQRAGVAMQLFAVMPTWLTRTAAVEIRALRGLGQDSRAAAVADRVLAQIQILGGAGHTEVEFRLAVAEVFHAAHDFERARRELRETLRQIQLRADDVPDLFWRNSYLTRNPYGARAQELGQAWGLDLVISEH